MKLIREALSTRKTMQNLPPMEEIHYITDQDLKKLQQCFLEMMIDIDKICEKNGIDYMAAGGTCLGAVRHGGFIPWDDDVDLLMTREDLKKFVRLFKQELGDKYELTSPDSEYQLESLISAIYKKDTVKATLQSMNTDLPKGVHIDIFSIENVPENKIHRVLKGCYATILQYIAVSSMFLKYTDNEKKAFFYQTLSGKINYTIRYIIGSAFSFKDSDFWAKAFENAVKYEKQTTLCAVPTDIGHYFGHIMPKSVYFPTRKAPFENIMINIPNDTDKYLSNQYGDYMTIPPESGREKHWSIGFDLGNDE